MNEIQNPAETPARARTRPAGPAGVIVREGNVRLRVSPNPKIIQGRRVVDWEIRWKDAAGYRRRLKRAEKSATIAEARRIAKQLSAGARELSGQASGEYEAALLNLEGTPFKLPAATALVRSQCSRLASAGVAPERFEAIGREAIEFYLAHHAAVRSRKPFGEVVDELIAARQAEGCRETHLNDLRTRGRRLKRDFQVAIGDLTAPMLNRWLWGIQCAPRSRLNFWRVLSNIINFAIAQAHLPRGFDALQFIRRPQLDDQEIEVFTPGELRLILQHVRLSALPVILLGAFGGLRTSETFRLDWSHIHWQREVIQVPRNTKTGLRNMPLLPVLRSWLETLAPIPCRGPIVRVGNSAVADAMKLAAERAGFAWKHNGLRHSFVSYWTAVNPRLEEVSIYTGHSVAVLKRSYRRPDIFVEDANDWFGIYPPQLGFFGRLGTAGDRKICPLFAPSPADRAKMA